MDALLALARGIDGISKAAGWVASVLVLLSCVISAGNAVSRYALDLSSNAWLEIQWQMFAGIFLLGAAWVLKLNEHVRVDLIYGGLGVRAKLWVEVVGYLVFFFPVCFIMVNMTVPWFLRSFAAGEISANAGGLPVWPVKALLPFGFILLTLQGVAEFVRRIAALRGRIALDVDYEKPVQ